MDANFQILKTIHHSRTDLEKIEGPRQKTVYKFGLTKTARIASDDPKKVRIAKLDLFKEVCVHEGVANMGQDMVLDIMLTMGLGEWSTFIFSG